jgi:hypothetical protein
MRHWWGPGLALTLALVGSAARPTRVRAQGADTAATGQEQIIAYARAHVAIARLRDAVNAELADPKNKKDEEQARVREKLRAGIARILEDHGFTRARFEQVTRLVSSDPARRREFDAAVARLAPAKDAR